MDPERAAAANVREDPSRGPSGPSDGPSRGPSGPTRLAQQRRLASILAAVRLFHRLWAGACRTGAPRLRYRRETSSRAYREQSRRRRPTEGGVPCPTCTPPRTRPRTRPTRVATGACWTRRRADGVARKRDRRDRGFETRAARDPRRDRPTRAESRPRRVRRLGTVHLRRRRGRWRRARIGARPGRASGRRGRSRRARRRRRSARDRRGPPRTAVAPARARGRWSPRPRAPRDANDRPRGARTAGGIVCARPSRNLGRTRRGDALARDRRRRPGPDRGSGAEGWSRNRSLDEAGGARPRRQSVCDRPERAEARRGALGCVRTLGRLGRGRPDRRDHRARRRDRHDRVRRVRRRARRRRARDAGRSRAIDRAEGSTSLALAAAAAARATRAFWSTVRIVVVVVLVDDVDGCASSRETVGVVVRAGVGVERGGVVEAVPEGRTLAQKVIGHARVHVPPRVRGVHGRQRRVALGGISTSRVIIRARGIGEPVARVVAHLQRARPHQATLSDPRSVRRTLPFDDTERRARDQWSRRAPGGRPHASSARPIGRSDAEARRSPRQTHYHGCQVGSGGKLRGFESTSAGGEGSRVSRLLANRVDTNVRTPRVSSEHLRCVRVRLVRTSPFRPRFP